MYNCSAQPRVRLSVGCMCGVQKPNAQRRSRTITLKEPTNISREYVPAVAIILNVHDDRVHGTLYVYRSYSNRVYALVGAAFLCVNFETI